VGTAFDAKSTNAASDCGKLDTAEPLCGKLATAEPICGKLASAGPEKDGADCGELDTAGALLEKLLPAAWKKESDWLLLAGWKLAKEGAALA
jgi:hypothetical protein